jgi:hypothetical protein
MNLKERISDLFEKYSVELAVEEKEEQVSLMATAILESGQEITTDADAFAVGVSVFVMNDENERIPLPDGDYHSKTALRSSSLKVWSLKSKTLRLPLKKSKK